MAGIKSSQPQNYHNFVPLKPVFSVEQIRATQDKVAKINKELREDSERAELRQRQELKHYNQQLTQKLLDETLVLFKPKKSDEWVTKHFVKVDGVVTEAKAIRKPTFFTHSRKRIQSFSDIIEMLDTVRDQFAVLGDVDHNLKQNKSEMRRLKNADNGIFDYRRQLAFLDFDHLEEISDLADPTKSHQHADKCVNKIQSFMPKSIQRANKVTRFSSSTGLKQNKVGIHIFAFLDEFQSEASMRELIYGIDRYMKRRIFVDVPIPKHHICDPKVATYNQPLFISPPILGEGIKAPFYFRDRHQFRVSETPLICVADLRREIEIDDALHEPIKTVRAKGVSVEVRQKQIREAAPAIYADDTIIDLAFARSQKKPVKLSDFIDQNPDGWTGNLLSYKKQCFELYRCNVLNDAIKLINVAGNLSGDADVNDVLTILVSLAAKKLPLEEITEERVVAITQHIAHRVFDDNDIANEKLQDWVGSRKYCTILSRAIDAAAGNRIEWGGRKDEDRRYGYTQSRVRSELILLLGDGADELIREHELTTLYNPADKQNKRRREKGRKTRDEYLSSFTSRELEDLIISLSEQNYSHKKIADLISDYWKPISKSSVTRVLSKPVHVRTSTVPNPVRSVASPLLNDVDLLLTSDPRESEIVNITNATCILENNCDLSVFDSPVPFMESNMVVDFISKCDPNHLVVQNKVVKHKAVAIHSVIDNKNTLAGHRNEVCHRYHVSQNPTKIISVDDGYEAEDGYVFDVIVGNNISFKLDPGMPLYPKLMAEIALIVKDIRVKHIDLLAA